MNADSMKVSVDELNSFAEDLDSETQAISQAYEDIKSQYQEIGGYWKSECWSAVKENFAANMQTMTDKMTELSGSGSAVCIVAKQYDRTEKVNQSLPDILPANIIK